MLSHDELRYNFHRPSTSIIFLAHRNVSAASCRVCDRLIECLSDESLAMHTTLLSSSALLLLLLLHCAPSAGRRLDQAGFSSGGDQQEVALPRAGGQLDLASNPDAALLDVRVGGLARWSSQVPAAAGEQQQPLPRRVTDGLRGDHTRLLRRAQGPPPTPAPPVTTSMRQRRCHSAS